ncbi:hydrolase [Streptomyces synnematoformans]|uniref:Cip1-like core domain-containing protein n=1 Tax=Streptomyces synnematoformans TaxID=415721 RepID=A0ABN2Y3G4_9ACTN
MVHAPAHAPARRSRRPRTALGGALALLLTAFTATAATAAAPAAAPPPAPAAACAADGFCEDFESQTGPRPSGRWSFQADDCTGTGTVTVDTAVAHGGTTSLRVNGGEGYCNHAFAGTALDDVPAGGDLYVRFWVRHTTALPTQHVTFLAMRDTGARDTDLRMGGQNAALQWNRESDDATLPAQSPAGVALSRPLPVDRWSCVEFRMERAGLLQTWLDGESVEGLIVDGTPTHDVDAQWLNSGAWQPAPADLRLGWESYGQGADTLWYDDVAVGTSRVGCA